MTSLDTYKHTKLDTGLYRMENGQSGHLKHTELDTGLCKISQTQIQEKLHTLYCTVIQLELQLFMMDQYHLH